MSAYSNTIAFKMNIRPAGGSRCYNCWKKRHHSVYTRYRKDKTGALDEVQIQQVQDEAKAKKNLMSARPL